MGRKRLFPGAVEQHTPAEEQPMADKERQGEEHATQFDHALEDATVAYSGGKILHTMKSGVWLGSMPIAAVEQSRRWSTTVQQE